MKKILLLLLILSVASCASKKDILYFQNIDDVQLKDINDISSTSVINKSDILRIKFSSYDMESVRPFEFEKDNLNRSNNSRIEQAKLEGYLVDENGNINIPQLGEVQVKGKTTHEVEQLLRQKLKPFVTDISVSVKIVNFKVTVFGSVKSPGTFDVSEEYLTLPQALGLAGDLNIRGKRHDVLIIRTKGDKRISKRIDLTKADWMNSDFYYLKQNDIVYVEPNNPEVKTAGFIGNLGTLLSITSILMTLALFIDKFN